MANARLREKDKEMRNQYSLPFCIQSLIKMETSVKTARQLSEWSHFSMIVQRLEKLERGVQHKTQHHK